MNFRPRTHPRLPNFLVIGAMKSGTTSLYQYMRHHPQVFMPEIKEVNFFNPRRNWRRGVSWYEEQFDRAPDDVIALGEASTSYTKFPWVDGVPARISSVLHDVRFIYVVRDPIDRMRSQYLHFLATGQERRPIHEALLYDPMYLNISRYALQIDQYLAHFSIDRFMIIDSRDLQNDRLATVRRALLFLGVDQDWVPPTIDDEFFRSAQRRMNPGVSRRIRGIPRVRTLGMYVPEPIKHLKRGIVSRLPRKDLALERAVVSDELRDQLRESLREDVASLRCYMPEGFDGWGIA